MTARRQGGLGLGLRLACAGLAWAAATGVSAQPASAAAGASAGVAQCNEALASVNRGMAERQANAFVVAAGYFEIGRCVARNEARAVELLAESARLGSPVGVRRLSRRFAWGQGVPQSYANAGSWLTGKGASQEDLQPWDYAVGYAHTVLVELLDRVLYPAELMQPSSEASFVVELDARFPRQVNLRPTADNAASQAALYEALRGAFNRPLADVLAALPPVDPALITSARVAIPVTLRVKGPAALDVIEDAPLLR